MKTLLALSIACLLISNLTGQSLSVDDLTCEYKVNPMPIEETSPRLAWKLKVPDSDSGVVQTAYQIQVNPDLKNLMKSKKLTWDSGKIHSDQSVHIEFDGNALQSGQRYYWRVKVWDNHNRESQWSNPAYWEMGLLDTRLWSANWISPNIEEKEKQHNPSPMLRREFKLKKNVKRARLYISSHGLYEVHLNGKRVGDEYFTPGWTSFDSRVQYQCYDVSDMIKTGKNATGVLLGDGWYRGHFGFANNWNIYGKSTALIYQLEVEYKNGKRDIIVSDGQWKSTTGPIRLSNLYAGERYDANQELHGWTQTGYDDSEWSTVQLEQFSKTRLIAPAGVPVKKIQELQAVQLFETPNGEQVIDFGQNLVGWVKFNVKGEKGDSVSIYHSEVLDKEGNFYTENLRTAEQHIHYTLKGAELETFEPHFTFQGFRYIKIAHYPGKIDKANFSAVVIHSEMPETGTFECSNPLINQLQSNILWGQKGNFLDVPTDCPQRDERMGWTGDAQAFAATACFNYNTGAFYTKWLADLSADQNEKGAVPFVVPNVLGDGAVGSTGWADAATIIPWTMYLKYGDKRILERQYQSMKDWVDFLKNLADDDLIVDDGFHFGDWLFFIHPSDWNAKPGYTDIDLIATAFFAHSTDLVKMTAEVLGQTEDVKIYGELHEEIKKEFQAEFVTESGRLSSHTQTAYTLALEFGLLKEQQIPNAVNYLTENIVKRNYHLSTGFLGTPYLAHVLTNYGKTDIAYKLLTQETYPSWLYPVTQGATTIWERWDGIKPDGSFQDVKMNSFNHYAYGAIGDWMYKHAAGIQEDPKQPGYKHIIFAPKPDSLMQYVKATHISQYGEISAAWNRTKDSIHFDFTVPPNTTATLILPSDVKNMGFEIGSGSYHYVIPIGTSHTELDFTIDTPLGMLWSNPKSKKLLIEIFPELEFASEDQLKMGFDYSIKFIAPYAEEVFTAERIKKMEEALQNL